VVTLPDGGDERGRDLRNLYTSLQGLVNRTSRVDAKGARQRIYLRQGVNDPSADLWMSEMNRQCGGVKENATNDLEGLLQKYKSEIKSLIIIKPELPDTINLATSLAGIERGLVVSPELAKRVCAALGESKNRLKIVDLRKYGFTSKHDVYDYALEQVWPRLNHRVFFNLDPQDSGHLRDYAVALGGMVAWLDPTEAPDNRIALLDPSIGHESRLLQKMFSQMKEAHGVTTLMGWFDNGLELPGISLAAKYGVTVAASNWSNNLSVLGGALPDLEPPGEAPPRPPLRNKVYVMLVGSDGDNLQRLQNAQATWDWPTRGGIAFNWTVSPLLVHFPVILNYYRRTMAPHDYLISGPSGPGYTYPDLWQRALLKAYMELTGRYMTRAGLSVITVWNERPLSELAQKYYAQYCHLIGLTDQDSRGVRVVSGLPKVSFANCYAYSVSDLALAIQSEVKAFHAAQGSEQRPGFVVVQANLNEPTLNPATLATLGDMFGDTVEFVRADDFFHLMAEAEPRAPKPMTKVKNDWLNGVA
jgi:hypothetical protein